MATVETTIATVPAAPPAVRNATYYFDDGDVVFQVHAELFRVHCFQLRRHSVVMADMLAMPINPATSTQGSSDQLPITIPAQVSVIAFGLLCGWLYRDLHTPESAGDAIMLLHLSDFWQMPKLHAHMSFHLTTLPDSAIIPSRRVWLARRYNMNQPAWVASAFRQLTVSTVDYLTEDDHFNLGVPTIRLLTTLFARLDRHRFGLAAHSPPASHVLSECSEGKQRSQCEGHWVDYWMESIAPLLHDDVTPARGPDIVAFMTSRRDMPFMMVTACMRLTFDTILEDVHVLMADFNAIEGDIPMLVALPP